MNNYSPTVSIVIPMYNESRYVGRCLDSLKAQTYKDFELIMIDDGSTDRSVQIVQSYQDQFKKLTVLKQQRGGPGKARNRWAQEATWEILVFVDADMVFDEHYIEELIKPIVEGKEVGTAHGREYVANKNHPIARAFSLVRLSYNPQIPRGGVFRAIRKDAFSQAGWFDTSKGYSDDDLTKRIGSSLSIPSAIAYHNNPESFSEIVKHSRRVWSSLAKTGEIQYYIKKYRLHLILLWAICSIGIIIWLQYRGLGLTLVLGIWILLGFVFALGVKRALREKYLSHVVYVPLVMFARIRGYLGWALQYLFRKSIY